MEAAGVPAKRLEPGHVLAEAFSTYRDNLGPLLGSAVVVFGVFDLASTLILETDFGLLAVLFVLNMAAQALYTAVVVKLVQGAREGSHGSTIGSLLASIVPAIVPLIVFTFLYALGTSLGFLLLLIPGLILMTIWSLGPPAIVIEGVGPIRAFRRSQDLVEEVGWSVFIVIFVTSAIVVGVGLALGALAAAISDGFVSAYVSDVLASALAAPIAALAVAVMYFRLCDAGSHTRF
jgi:hypothetical protein